MSLHLDFKLFDHENYLTSKCGLQIINLINFKIVTSNYLTPKVSLQYCNEPRVDAIR